MNTVDWIAMSVIIVLVVLALKVSYKNSCTGNCGSCHTNCSENRHPDFVRRYREDQARALQNRR
ncbi:MAG: hypothetical protein ACI32F_05945 [Allobaculum sp.]